MFVTVLNVKDILLKEAGESSKQTVQKIMDTIYNENPAWWPYGLNVEGHDSVYLIKDASNNNPVGFVGWQQFLEKGKQIGSYSVGILPEYRGNGLAKEAIAKILQDKSSKVDIVRAYIKKENTQSKHLANALHIPICEEF